MKGEISTFFKITMQYQLRQKKQGAQSCILRHEANTEPILEAKKAASDYKYFFNALDFIFFSSTFLFYVNRIH